MASVVLDAGQGVCGELRRTHPTRWDHHEQWGVSVIGDKVMIEFEAIVEGPFSEQPTLVKVGSWMISLLLFILGNYIPISLAVWLFLYDSTNLPQPQVSLPVWLFVGGILIGMFGIGMYCIASIINWFAGRRLGIYGHGAHVGWMSLVSVTATVCAAVAGVWDVLLIGAVAIAVLFGITGTLTISIGQVLGRRRNST